MGIATMGITDPNALVIAAAERYAFHAAIFSISLIVASAAMWLFLRNSLSCCCFVATPLFAHPIWTVTWVQHDNGATLRLASTIWIFMACAAMITVAISIYRHGVQLPQSWLPRFTCHSFLILIVLMVVPMALTRPPLSDEIPTARSVPALGILTMLFIGIISWPPRSVRKQPARFQIPPELYLQRD